MNLKQLFKHSLPPHYADLWLVVFRVSVGLFMLTHGLPKLTKLMSGGEIKFADPIGIGVVPSLVLTVFAEVFCSLFIIFGLATRFAAIPPIITMTVAVFIAHSGTPFEKRELALLYLVFYVTIYIFGAGKYSLDFLIAKRLK